MTTSGESAEIGRWASLVKSRRAIIGTTKESESGEEFTTCGDLELDHLVASIVLNSVQKRLPNYSVSGSNETVLFGRDVDYLRARNVQLLPAHLFTIDWSMTAPGVSWPETYSVTYIPSLNLRIVTASKDDSDLWGYTDLAIGLCPAVRAPDFGTKKIVQSWWARAGGCENHGWEIFVSAGLISKERAQKWKKEVFGTRSDYW